MEVRMSNTIWFKMYHGGVAVAFTLDESATRDTIARLLARVDDALSLGLAVEPPQASPLAPGAEREVIEAVVLRQQSKGGIAVDCYPAWNASGTFGQYKWGQLYLDTPEQVREFEQLTGLEINRLQPLGVDVAPLRRTHGRRHPCEYACRPFYLTRVQVGERDGKPVYKYALGGSAAPVASNGHAGDVHWSDERGAVAALVERCAANGWAADEAGALALSGAPSWRVFPTRAAAAEAIKAAAERLSTASDIPF
jgi:hypothetical protein